MERKTVRVPGKNELLGLLDQHKSTRKIAEILGVPKNIVIYWLKKKNVKKIRRPKYSQNQITVLWEKYKSDKTAGKELGISRTTFFNWRKKYGLVPFKEILKPEPGLNSSLKIAPLSASSSAPYFSRPFEPPGDRVE